MVLRPATMLIADRAQDSVSCREVYAKHCLSLEWSLAAAHPAPPSRRPTRSRYPILGYGSRRPSTHYVDKAIYSEEHRRLTTLLRTLREEAGLRQIDVADGLGVPQSFVSKYESGERRLDLIELRQVCQVLGIRLSELVQRFDAE